MFLTTNPSRLALVPITVVFLLNMSSTLAAETERSYPTNYFYKGEEISFELLNGKLAVLRSAKTQSDGFAEKVAGALHESAKEIDLGNTRWSMLELSSAPSSKDVGERIEKLSTISESDFVSPVFSLPNIDWVIVTPDILLRFKPEHIREADALLESLAPDLKIVETNFGALTGAYKLRSSSKNGFEVLAQANELSLHDQIAWAEPDFRFSVPPDDELNPIQRTVPLGSTPNHVAIRERNFEGLETVVGLIPDDPGFVNLWGSNHVSQFGGTPGVDADLPRAWQITTGDSSIKILVLDNGVQQDHPDINQLPGLDFTGAGAPGGTAANTHGTIVAGVITAKINNALGTVGVAPDCRVISARVWDGFFIQSSWLVNALAYAESEGVRVTTASIRPPQSSALTDKYNSTYAGGMIHFEGAGNDGADNITYPGNLSSVNSAGGIGYHVRRAHFSNYGANLEFCAPAVHNYTTDKTGTVGLTDGDYVFDRSGTSYASPFVAGVAALILSVDSTLTAPEVEDILRCSATDLGAPGWDEFYGYGLVNAYAAVLAASGADSDGDGENDGCDNCPVTSNAGQTDTDFDGLGDACDVCPNDPTNDLDGDGVCGESDNCPGIANPGQEDSDLNGTGDACECDGLYLSLAGAEDFDQFGREARGAGDVNNDGFDDIIVGAWGDGPTDQNGRVYVYSGADGALLYEINLGETFFGWAVNGIGDVNLDGYDDFIVGSLLYFYHFGIFPGGAYVYYGGPGPFPIFRVRLSADRIHLGNSIDDLLGASVAGIGDIDGDAIPDYLSGAPQPLELDPGYVNVYSGQTGSIVQTVTGENALDWFGASAAGAGDVDNDGVADYIVGAPFNDVGGLNAGRAYVYSGLTLTPLYTFTGESAGDHFGYEVAGAGDVDNDGFDDLFVGAPFNDAGGEDAGKLYIYSGQTGALIHQLSGSSLNAYLGWSGSSIGDFDTDSFDDVVFGVPGSVQVSILSGQTGSILHTLYGDKSDIGFGMSVDGAIDIGSDGQRDIIIGAPLSSTDPGNSGKAFVYVPCCCTVSGDANNSGSINISDATFIIAYIFSGGGAPPCLDEGDANGSNSINISDATYIIAFIFSGGLAPVCGTTGA